MAEHEQGTLAGDGAWSLIARHLSECRPHPSNVSTAEELAYSSAVNAVADALEENSPRAFNREAFMEAAAGAFSGLED